MPTFHYDMIELHFLNRVYVANLLDRLLGLIINYRQMQHIQLNQRELSLQRIIKAQEARISELQGKLAEGNNIDKLKLEAAVKELTLKYQHKEKEIGVLKEELSKYKTDLRESRQNLRYSRQYERDSLLTENKSLQNRVRQMEDRIRTETERNQTDVTKLLKMNQTLQKQVNFYKSSVASIEVQIEKLQIFYRSALVELPKRVDTLQWVDNFIRFMGQYQATLSHKPLQPGVDKVQKELLDFKVEFSNKAREMLEAHNIKVIELQKVKEEVQTIIKDHLNQTEQIVEQNEVFWENIKKEKASKASQNQKRLEEQICQLKEHYSKETATLTANLKTFEQEKRQLSLAYLQLKGYYEHREKNLTDEIKILKQNSQKLIQMGEKRQQTFQTQVSKLSSQVAQITRKYEDNIRIPFEDFNRRFATDMRSIIQQIGNFPYKQKCGNIVTRLDGRCKQAQILIRRASQKQTAAQQSIQKYLEQIKIIQNNLERNVKFIVDTIDRYGDQSLGADFINEQQQLYDQTITKLELEELQARKNYQIDLLKQNNSKLQELVTRLQASGGQQDQQDHTHHEHIDTTKIHQLQIQVNLLKDLLEKYQRKFHQNLKKLRFAKYDKQVINVIAENLSKYEGLFHELRDYIENIVVPTSKSQNEQYYDYFQDIKTTAKQIQEFVELPIKRLNQLVKYNEQVNLLPKIEPVNLSRVSETVQILSNFKEQVKAYKEILAQKDKPKTNISKTLSEMIQLLRSSLPSKQSQANKEPQEAKTSRKMKTQSGIEKRIRDIQAARLKDKSQLSTLLDKLSKAIKKVQAPRNKSKQCQQILSRTEFYLKERIEYIVGMLEYPVKGKQPSNEFNQVAKKAIQDLQSKLKEAVYENEGLTKEFKLLSNFNQTFREGASSKKAQ